MRQVRYRQLISPDTSVGYGMQVGGYASEDSPTKSIIHKESFCRMTKGMQQEGKP
jgi:hypothetical protein